MVEYTDPTTGAPVFKTITFFVQMLRPGERTRPLRQTSSLLVAPVRGGGHSIVDGKRFDWKQFDTLAVPAARGASTSTAPTATRCSSSWRATSRR